MTGRRWYLRKRLWLPVLLIAAGYVYVRTHPLVFNESMWSHAHCIKQAGFPFEDYARKNDGKFPFHPDGYPAALLLLDQAPGYCLTGPGYDGAIIDEARQLARRLTEEDCGRVYIQGLTLKSNSELCYFFDKIPTPGGDHCPFPFRMWRPLGRELLTIGDGHRYIEETEWPAFVRRQIEVLVQEGFDDDEVKRLYGVTQ